MGQQKVAGLHLFVVSAAASPMMSTYIAFNTNDLLLLLLLLVPQVRRYEQWEKEFAAS
jgi:hypothetical protein